MNFTEVNIIHNYDGCHISKALAGYLNCSALTALGILLGDYYIASYNHESLYSMTYVGYKYALELNDVECIDSREFYMMNSRQINPIIPVYDNGSREFIHIAKVEDQYEQPTHIDDYTNRLRVLLENNDDIKTASNIYSIVSDYSDMIVSPSGILDFKLKLSELKKDSKITKTILNEIFGYCISQSKISLEV